MIGATTDQITIQLPAAFPWGIAIIGREEGTVLSANEHMRDLYRCKEGGNVDQFFHAGKENDLRSIIKRLAPGKTWTGRIYPQENSYGIASVDVMLQREAQDDVSVWLYTLEHPKVNDEVRYSSRSELKMLRVLLDNTLEYIYFRDIHGKFILTNKAFRVAVSDGEKTPEVDRTIADFISEESAAWFTEMDQQLKESGHAVVNEVSRVTLNSGLQHWLQLSVVPVRNGEGEMIGTLSVARDISELKNTEEHLRHAIDQARAASKAKGEFLAAMSHEIRTPINGIIGASELCEETRLDREQRSYINTVLECGSTLLTLVNDVLDFSKIEAGQLSLEKLNFVPRTLMENVAEGFVQETRKKGIELITAYDNELPNYIMGDPTRLKQVLNNLVSNAVKFTPEGEIVIRAETISVSEKSTQVRFSVKDTGIGITKDRQDAIFESFTQEDMSTTRKYGGTGLGLSISRELVELMGGKLAVSSEVGEGSVFSFEATFDLSSYHGAEAVPFNPELAGMRVLIVDDNETNREIYSQMCAGWGYRSGIAKNGTSAISALEKAREENDPFELVILDQQMPDLAGLDVASLIKSRPDLKETRIILLSSSIDRKESERATEIGIARALSKPVKRHTLLEVILETFEVGYPGGKLSKAKNKTSRMEQSLDLLLVEDNPINQVVAKQRLKKLGHKVTLAEDSIYALEAVNKKRFDGILMDIQMPGMDGYETTAAIRKYENKSGMKPHYIIAMTAHAMQGDKERCLAAGMNEYIAKPFRVERLREVLLLAAAEKQLTGTAELGNTDFSSCLDALNEDDREDLLAAAGIFIRTLPEDVAKLKAAVENQDFKQVYFLAHSLKSVAGLFGQEESASLAASLEEASEKKVWSQIPQSVEKLIDLLEVLSREIQVELSNTKA